jgi:chromosome segregation ATPase
MATRAESLAIAYLEEKLQKEEQSGRRLAKSLAKCQDERSGLVEEIEAMKTQLALTKKERDEARHQAAGLRAGIQRSARVFPYDGRVL